MCKSFACLFLLLILSLCSAYSQGFSNGVGPQGTHHVAAFDSVPGAVQLVSPRNGERLGVGPDSVLFVWNKVQGTGITYAFEIALHPDSLFHVLKFVDSSIVDTTRQFPIYNIQKYWWRVRARNINGWGPYSATFWLIRLVVPVDDWPNAPIEYVLDQNYPNPFNPSTTIRYAIPVRSQVSLAVYNTLGQRIAELVNGEVEAGYHEVRFSAARLPSGVYFYRMQAGRYSEAKTLLLLR